MSVKTQTLITDDERRVVMQLVYGCQRWPVGARLSHERTGLEVEVLDFEWQGVWLGRTGHDPETGERLDRYCVFPVYLVKVPARRRRAYLEERALEEL